MKGFSDYLLDMNWIDLRMVTQESCRNPSNSRRSTKAHDDQLCPGFRYGFVDMFYLNGTKTYLHLRFQIKIDLKGIDQFWSCDCIVKETLWNRSEKVNHCTARF